MHRKRHLPAVVAAACLLLTAAACNGEPDAESSTTPISTPSSTPMSPPTKPSSIPPTMPPAAQSGLTVTSAEAFARFYLAAVDYLVGTGDAKLVRQWAEKGCQSCKALADQYEAMYRLGGSVTGDTRTQIVSTTQAKLSGKDTAIVVFRAKESSQVETERAGAKPVVQPGQAVTWDITLAAASGHWTMFEMEQI